MSIERNHWNYLTWPEKIDAMGVLLLKLADNLEGGKVHQLNDWIQVITKEKDELRAELTNVKKELTAEKKKSTFHKNTADRYRKQIENLLPLIPNGAKFKKSTT